MERNDDDGPSVNYISKYSSIFREPLRIATNLGFVGGISFVRETYTRTNDLDLLLPFLCLWSSVISHLGCYDDDDYKKALFLFLALSVVVTLIKIISKEVLFSLTFFCFATLLGESAQFYFGLNQREHQSLQTPNNSR